MRIERMLVPVKFGQYYDTVVDSGSGHHHHVIDLPVLHGFSHCYSLDMPSNDILLTKSVKQTSDLLRIQVIM
jgi:hypothetical protein